MRKFLAMLLFLVMTVSLGFANGQQDGAEDKEETVNIGVLGSVSGTLAFVGSTMMVGTEFAIEQRGEVLGKKFEIIPIDTEGKPAVAARKVREWADKGVKYFTTANSSSVALAVAQVAQETKSIFITSVGADEVTNQNANNYTFRWSLPTYGATRGTLIPLMEMYPDAQKFYTITVDYVFGHSLLENAKNVIEEYGREHVGNDLHVGGTTEYSSYLAKAVASGADVLVLLNYGKDAITTIKQAYNFGITDKMKVLYVWSNGVIDLDELGETARSGLFFGSQYWHTLDFPRSKALSQAWFDKYGEQISYSHMCAYMHADLLFDAIEKANSFDTKDIAMALEGMEWEGTTQPVEKMLAYNHQAQKSYFLLQAKSTEDMADESDYAELLASSSYTRPESEFAGKLEPWN